MKYIQFPGILGTDDNPIWNGCSFTGTVDELVVANPQFWWAPGLSGVYTLYSAVNHPAVDTVLTVSRNNVALSVTGAIILHPPHAPH